jgi:hypothetical protein
MLAASGLYFCQCVIHRIPAALVELCHNRSQIEAYFIAHCAMKIDGLRFSWRPDYSTVTLLARFRGWSTSRPREAAMW